MAIAAVFIQMTIKISWPIGKRPQPAKINGKNTILKIAFGAAAILAALAPLLLTWMELYHA